jgi:thymidylate kinase
MSQIKYVSLVGVERCGKGTQINLLKDFFGDGEGVDFLREPGTTTLGDILRAGMKPEDSDSSLYLNKSTLAHLADSMKNLSSSDYFYMMMFQRGVLMRNISSGKAGDKLISDRGHLCTYAYQLCAQKLSMRPAYQELWLNAYKKMFEGVDDLHIILDIEPEESLKRKASRKSSDPFDEASLDFINNVRTGYDLANDLLSDAKPDMINGMRSKEEVFDDLRKAIQNHFKD